MVMSELFAKHSSSSFRIAANNTINGISSSEIPNAPEIRLIFLTRHCIRRIEHTVLSQTVEFTNLDTGDVLPSEGKPIRNYSRKRHSEAGVVVQQ